MITLDDSPLPDAREAGEAPEEVPDLHRSGILDRRIGKPCGRRAAQVQDSLASEAVHVMSERKFSELPVVDGTGRPVGLLDITDLIGMGFASDDDAAD